MDAKIVASAVFIDFGITDAITGKHRQYPASFVIPMPHKTGVAAAVPASTPAMTTPVSPSVEK
jgi:hypothetical protein